MRNWVPLAAWLMIGCAPTPPPPAKPLAEKTSHQDEAGEIPRSVQLSEPPGAARLFAAAVSTASLPPLPAAETMLNNWTVGGVRPPSAPADDDDVQIHLALAGHDGYVESDSCTGCHAEQAASYARSAHANSLRAASDAEPPRQPGVLVDHHASGRRYDRLIVDGVVVQRESIELPTPPGMTPTRMSVAQWPVRYVMGSGAFATTAILGDGDDLMQSPVTWYRRAADHAMSPGYDAATHLGMNRAIADRCLACHVGSLQYVDNLDSRPRIVEHTIGCQRCHGPGQSHNQYHGGSAADLAGDTADGGDVSPRPRRSPRQRVGLCPVSPRRRADR